MVGMVYQTFTKLWYKIFDYEAIQFLMKYNCKELCTLQLLNHSRGRYEGTCRCSNAHLHKILPKGSAWCNAAIGNNCSANTSIGDCLSEYYEELTEYV